MNRAENIFLVATIKEILKRKSAAFYLFIIVTALLFTICFECYTYYCHSANITPFYDITSTAIFQAPSLKHFFGTDYRGRDVFVRALAGTATAVKVGIIASAISAIIGVILGALAGYYGGKIDNFVVWIYSTFASMPTLLFILSFALLVSKGFLLPPLASAFNFIAAILNTEPSMLAIYIGIGITGWVSLCRVVRAETMKLRETAYVQAAKASGFRSTHIILGHIIPNLFHLVIIYFTMRFAYAIMTEVIVSYLGLGAQASPSWGVMISDGQQRLWRGIWWEVTAASVFMFLLVMSLHLLGDRLRDVLDPKIKS